MQAFESAIFLSFEIREKGGENPPREDQPFKPRLAPKNAQLPQFHSLIYLTPGVLEHLVDVVALRDVALQHATDEVDALVAQRVGHP